MLKLIRLLSVVFVMSCATVVFAAPAKPKQTDAQKRDALLYKSVALLLAFTDDGGTRQFCTCTPFERDANNPNLYRFVTAAHCGSMDNFDKQEVELEPIKWAISFDDVGKTKTYYEARVLYAGYMSAGDDVMVMEAEISDRELTVYSFSKNAPMVNETILNVSSPLGLGKQHFNGYVTNPYLDRPLVDGDINWTGFIMLDINSGPGSSGSSVMDAETHQIIGILVGGISYGASKYTTVVPASRFLAFYEAAKSGKYRYFKPDNQSALPTGKIKGAMQRIENKIKLRMSGDIRFGNEPLPQPVKP